MSLKAIKILFAISTQLVILFVITGCGDRASSQSSLTTRSVSSWKGTQQFGSLYDDIGLTIATDSKGNIYVAGYTSNSNTGFSDVVLTKFDSSGTLLWTRQTGVIGSSSAEGVAVDSNDNVYIVGTILTGYNTSGLDGNINAGGNDIFLIKYDAFGNKQWSKQMGSTRDDYARGIALNKSGYIYITGFTSGGLDGNTNTGAIDAFLIKLDATGTKLWTKQWGSAGYDEPQNLAIDSKGNVLVTGVTDGNLDGNINAGWFDIFLVKFDGNGEKQWSKQLGGTSYDSADNIAIDADGNAYIIGSLTTVTDPNINTGTTKIILSKFNTSGIELWRQQFGTADNDYGRGITIDSNGNIYVSGTTFGTLGNHDNAGGRDVFLTKFDSSGTMHWIRQIGSSSDDNGLAVTVDIFGDILITGMTSGGLDGNTSLGGFDIFLVRYDTSGLKK